MATQTFQVEGMSCGHCELSIQEEVGEIPGVTSVKADHTTGEVVVEGAEVSRELSLIHISEPTRQVR